MYVGCDFTSIDDEGLSIKTNSLPSYVRYDINVGDTIDAVEGSTASIEVELPTTIYENVSFDFEFSGNAVFGEDFTVEGATASGGTLSIEYDPENTGSFDAVDIDVVLLRDAAADGVKNLTITLVSAVSESGAMLGAGQGTSNKVTTVKIADIDCALDMNNFTGVFQCDEPGYAVYDVNLALVSSDPPVIENDNFWDSGLTAQYQFDPSLETTAVTIIPFQFDPGAGMATVTGSGTYNSCDNVFEVDYTIVRDSDGALYEANTHSFFK
jgi:hypothetical protein